MKSATLTSNQSNFARYLADIWERGPQANESAGSAQPLLHGYGISRSRHWKCWRARFDVPVRHWWCSSLAEAAHNYSWPEDDATGSFASLSARLRSALEEGDEARTLQLCLDIFKWGGVARKPEDKSRIWVNEQFRQGTLCQSIDRAVALLQPGPDASLGDFDGRTLLMNAAMTKVYAAADPEHIIIYDGRVGAALGMLVCRWLGASGADAVPADLAFRWGAGQGATRRNPSQGGYRFSSLYLPSSQALNQDEAWATLVRKTGQILAQMKRLNPAVASVGHVERALFMLGFSVEVEQPAVPRPVMRARS